MATFAWVKYRIKKYNSMGFHVTEENKTKIKREQILGTIGSGLALITLGVIVVFSASVNYVYGLHLFFCGYVGIVDPVMLIWNTQGMKSLIKKKLQKWVPVVKNEIGPV